MKPPPPALLDTRTAMNSPSSSGDANLDVSMRFASREALKDMSHLPTGVRRLHSAAYAREVGSSDLVIMSVVMYPYMISSRVL